VKFRESTIIGRVQYRGRSKVQIRVGIYKWKEVVIWHPTPPSAVRQERSDPSPDANKPVPLWSIDGSGVGALIKQPFAGFSRRKLLIAIVTRRYYARRGLAANDGVFGVASWTAEAFVCRGPVRAPLEHTLQNRPALGRHVAARDLSRSRDSDDAPQQCSPCIRDDTYRLPAR
jgi:hypothetical protein